MRLFSKLFPRPLQPIDAATRWWHDQNYGRPPAWVVTADPAHQTVLNGLLDGFWQALTAPSERVDHVARRLTQWDQTTAQTLASSDLPEPLVRLVQSWRMGTADGDVKALTLALKSAAKTTAVLPQRPMGGPENPDWQNLWRSDLQRFGHVAMVSDHSQALDGWASMQRLWSEAWLKTAQRLNEPDTSMGAHRWVGRIVEEEGVDARYDPVANSIAVAVPKVQALNEVQHDDVRQRWERNLSHERGHALDFWLGEASTSPLNDEEVKRHGFAMRERPSDPADPLALKVPVAPFSVRYDVANRWQQGLRRNIPFVNACVATNDAEYYLRSSEITARLWEGFVQPTLNKPNLFPSTFMDASAQEAVRNYTLMGVGLPTHRSPIVAPSIGQVAERLGQRFDAIAPRLDVDLKTSGPKL